MSRIFGGRGRSSKAIAPLGCALNAKVTNDQISALAEINDFEDFEIRGGSSGAEAGLRGSPGRSVVAGARQRAASKTGGEDPSYTGKGMGRQGIGSFRMKFLCFSTMPCRPMILLAHFREEPRSEVKAAPEATESAEGGGEPRRAKREREENAPRAC